MTPRYRSVAVIGTGPSGVAAVRALAQENVFDTIRVFERRDRMGGIWHYDSIPDVFPEPSKESTTTRKTSKPAIPSRFPQFTPPSLSEDTTSRSAVYDALDSNVGAAAMAFTHTPFPDANSAASIHVFGRDNPTRPFRVVAGYLEDLFQDYLHLVSFNTTVEKVEKKDDNDNNSKWTLTLRRSGQLRRGQPQDYWWQEHFDAVVVASGHYSVPLVPTISGLDVAFRTHPSRFEHVKSFRTPDHYVNKKVVVVGGNVSAGDLVADLHGIVRGPLYLSQRGKNEALQALWDLPTVEVKAQVKHIEATASGINVTFADDSRVDDIDKIIFATGYRLSYPFLNPDPVTANNRLAGFYQHIFKIGDPSLSIVGQVRGAISFRVYEYQAIAVARYFAGRNGQDLPSPAEQDQWEFERLQYKGPSHLFHEIRPDFKPYFNYLRDLAGPPAEGSDAYELPAWEDRWAELGFAVLQLKDKYWKRIGKTLATSPREGAKL